MNLNEIECADHKSSRAQLRRDQDEDFAQLRRAAFSVCAGFNKEKQKVNPKSANAHRFQGDKAYSFLAVLIDLGLQAVVVEGKLRVFGFSSMAPDEARKAGAWIREHAAELVAEITAIDVFRARRPGYCPTCPAYVHGWEILLAGKRHTEWCVHSAWFLGRAGKPIPLERYEPGIDAFKLKRGKCPQLRG